MSKRIIGFICSAAIYDYHGWLFEYSRMGGPWPVRRDNGELFKRAGKRFWKMFEQFCKEEDQDQFRVGGGCEEIIGGVDDESVEGLGDGNTVQTAGYHE